MPEPVNVLLNNPTIELENWDEQAQRWAALNAQIGGNEDFYPLTIKGAYVIGIIHQLCVCVSVLLQDATKYPQTYIPAYGIFASGVELLGRCLEGNATTRNSTRDLCSGLGWLASPIIEQYQQRDLGHVLITTPTNNNEYTINNLAGIRHFAAHGQAAANEVNGGYQFRLIDTEILSMMPPLLANGLEHYWHALKENEDLCNRLAEANIIALRNGPVFESWNLFERDKSGHYASIQEIFNRFDWILNQV